MNRIRSFLNAHEEFLLNWLRNDPTIYIRLTVAFIAVSNAAYHLIDEAYKRFLILKNYNLKLDPVKIKVSVQKKQVCLSVRQDDAKPVLLNGLVGLSNLAQNNCILFKIDTKKFDERCLIGNQVLKINNEFAFSSIDYTKYSFFY
ncbi:hypothetical protein HZS_7149 [Henneguya salminicola]|nr:hypothetical protein HZS_7149 [Henneguya salminicola]